MSKSLQRVMDALTAAQMGTIALEMPSETRTAEQAAEVASCEIDQIAKSIIFAGSVSGDLFLFITAGGNQVDADRASALAGEPLTRAHPGVVRDTTGFAIGSIAPIGHVNPIKSFFDVDLQRFGILYAAAGTPRHIFAIGPDDLLKISESQPAEFKA
ncbi:MAG: YbaK/EbsC family protein [Yoonia sp.]|nr:YbaK/EbsC family protein [Yoonia sp.]